MFVSFLLNGMLFLSLAPVLPLLCLYFPDQDLYSHNAHGSSWIDSRWSHIAANKKTCVPCRIYFLLMFGTVFSFCMALLTWTAGCILIGCLWDHRSTKCPSEWPVSAPPAIVLRAHPRVLTFSHLLPYCYHAKPIITHQKTVTTCNFNPNLWVLLSLLRQPIDNPHQCF